MHVCRLLLLLLVEVEVVQHTAGSNMRIEGSDKKQTKLKLCFVFVLYCLCSVFRPVVLNLVGGFEPTSFTRSFTEQFCIRKMK